MEGLPMGIRRGVSPVIVTVVLIAVAVTIAIAVALWASNMIGSINKPEKIQIENTYFTVIKDGTGELLYYNITLSCKNIGSTDAIITQAFINGEPLKVLWSISSLYLNDILWIERDNTSFREITFPAGTSIILVIILPIEENPPITMISGQLVEVKIVTASGLQYVSTFTIGII